MRFPQLTHRVALGMGAIGLVLASGGAATAAVSAIQPAGALSAQVPAVGVREQNVNSAGRIRVALPKNSIGVNGSVSVSNLPENSAGHLETSPAAPTKYVTASGTGGGTSTVLPAPPTGEVYHLGLVTIDEGCNDAYPTGDALATSGPDAGNIANFIVPQQGNAVLPFDGLTLGPDQGLTFGSNASSSTCWSVTVDYWLS